MHDEMRAAQGKQVRNNQGRGFLLGLGLLILLGLISIAQQEETVINVPRDYETIQEAIDAAEVGIETTIMVAQGTYLEDLHFEGKGSLILKGAGSDKTVILGSIKVDYSENIVLEGFTISGGAYGIEITESIITLRENQILASRGKGVSIDKSLATFQGNMIAEHPGQGLQISQTKVIFLQNKILGNQGAGLVLDGESSAILSGNTISGNQGDGISLRGSSAEIKGNVIRENQGCGIRVEEGAAISGADNLVAKNAKDNLCPPTLPRTLTANIRSVPEDFPTIADAISAIPQDPVILIAPGIYRVNLELTTQNLELRGSDQQKVILLPADSSMPAIEIQGSGILIQGMTIRGGRADCLVKVKGDVRAYLRDLRISGRQPGPPGAGLIVMDTAEVHLRGVQLIRNAGGGLLVEDSGSVELQDSQVTGNEVQGLLLRDQAIAALRYSQVTQNMGKGLKVWDNAQLLMEENSEVSGNSGEGLEIGPSAATLILDSSISGNGGHGIWVRGFAELNRSRIQGNRGCGVRAELGAQILGVENTISGNQAGDLCPASFPWPPNFKKGG